ncbi:methylated-DNA--[protein]-cysteine S-methyltransferase [Paenibacillus sp. SI8]|uniref:methylated-DNA--[protein]-cysteine S-methyltransferase n=1 Tax=unclassified Paenibacillus TaxID=185978 RepID=UPI0034652144
MQKKPVYWTIAHVDRWDVLIAATERGLCYLQFMTKSPSSYEEDEAWSGLLNWVRKQAPELEVLQDLSALQPYIVQIEAYLSGRRTSFTLPLDLRGTPFQMAVWQELQGIPHGGISSYSQIAGKLEKAKAVRAVGTAIGANPVLVVVPCHRVLGKDGSLTGYRGGIQTKESLLLLEKSKSGQRAASKLASV